MKELSIEEKAKRYDEAIEIAKEINNEQRAQPFNIMTRVFPELAESEDEKIRKALIKYLSALDDDEIRYGVSFKDMRAWLEKQGEKGIVLRDTFGYEEGRQKGQEEGIMLVLDNPQKYGLKKQGEQKHTAEEVLIKAGLKPYKDGDQWCVLLGDNIQEGICGFGNTIEDALYAFLKDLIASQGEQKPAWSEEDQSKIRHLIAYLEKDPNTVIMSRPKDEWIDFLKSLKDRVQPQQEWSDEDKDALEDILDCAVNGIPLDEIGITWLESLKNKCIPQPKQEWSEEDERCRKALLHLLEHYSILTSERESCIVWLKSLKDRVQPQNGYNTYKRIKPITTV